MVCHPVYAPTVGSRTMRLLAICFVSGVSTEVALSLGALPTIEELRGCGETYILQ